MADGFWQDKELLGSEREKPLLRAISVFFQSSHVSSVPGG